MAENEGSDRMNLLEHTASIAKSLLRYDNSNTSYEMVDVETSILEYTEDRLRLKIFHHHILQREMET
jgi:hypothetical protein